MLKAETASYPEEGLGSRESMRIAVLCIHSCPFGELGARDTGGMNVYVRELAQSLGGLGHSVDIFTRLHDQEERRIMRPCEHVRLIHLRAGSDGDMQKLAIYPYLRDFFRELEGFRKGEGLRYDLVHSHYWLSGRVGKWAQEAWDVPHLLMFHTLGAVKNRVGVGEREPDLRIATERQLVDSCDRIIAATERERTDLVRHYGARPDAVGVVPCGVSLELFRPLDKRAARKALGLDLREAIVLYVGRFDALKGLDRLLGAMPRLQPGKRGIRLVIVGGDGEEEQETRRLKALARQLGVQDSVTFAGRVEQHGLPPYYSAADVLAVPSHHESFGLVALESLACGTPVVATRVGALDMLLRGGETGCVVEDGAPPALAEKIGDCLSRVRAGNGRTDGIRASAVPYGWPKIAQAVIGEYRVVLDARKFRALGGPAEPSDTMQSSIAS